VADVEKVAEAEEIIAEVGEERALSLSTRFLNQSDPLWKNANGIESTVSASEFAEILKNSPVYKGGRIRLISCETGADDAIAAKYLSKYLGEEVMAPTDIVHVFPDGEMVIGPDEWTNTGTWKVFTPN